MAMNRLRPNMLRDAIEGDALTMHYGVQVHVPSGRLAGVEGYVRWPHPAHGMLGPGEIVPLVEEGLLYVQFDRWVIREMCTQVLRWRRSNVLVPLVAANLWPQTLRQPAFDATIRDALSETGADATMLEIELPPGALSEPSLAEHLREIRRVGVRIASDDLSRDPSTVGHHADTLKIARGSDPEAVKRVVEAGRQLVARVVAEGVETAEQRDALVDLGCEIQQGYIFGPEVSAAEVVSMVVR